MRQTQAQTQTRIQTQTGTTPRKTGRIAALALAALAGLTIAAPARAELPPLREVSEIDQNMLWVGIAIEISDRCDEIDARTLKGLSFLYDLRSQAKAMGYTDAQIKSYIRSPEEKARIRALGVDYAKSQGFDASKTAGLCALGKHEIARNSQIGVLLKAK